MSGKESSSSAKGNGKDVIYIDADDEITGVIDKVRGSDQKIVALVLPKRAAVLQSVVNMKLLKRTADGAKKNIVLITSEVSLLPLAGSIGLHVAKSLQSKPEVPDVPTRPDDTPETVDEDDDDADSTEESLDKTRSIGELASAGIAMPGELDDTIELGDDDEDEASTKDADANSKAAGSTKGKNKKLKIPNFNKFRMLLILGGVGVVGLVVLAFVCLSVLPKATIVIKTDSTAATSNAAITLKTGDSVALDMKQSIVPAHKQEVKKTLNQQVSTTGQQNNGLKAAGSIKFYNCNKDDTLTGTSRTILAGTGVNSGGMTYIISENVVVQPSNFNIDGSCKKNVLSASVTMTAQQGGAKYNQDATNYVVAGYSTITGVGTATTGGTDDITKIVTQADIDAATQKIAAGDTAGIKEELKTDLVNIDFYPIEVSFNTANPETKTSANPGDKADNVTVTQTITYSMLGAKEADLKKVIANDVADKIDPSKQTILEYGLDKGDFLIQEQLADGAKVTMQTTVVAGPDLKVDDIKKQVAGKKSGDAQELIKAFPGVTDVTVEYSPFWVGSIPKKTAKITITVEKPQAPAKADDAQQSSP